MEEMLVDNKSDGKEIINENLLPELLHEWLVLNKELTDIEI